MRSKIPSFPPVRSPKLTSLCKYATSRNLARSTWVGVGAPGPHAHAETLAAVGDASVQRGKETALRLIVAFVIATKHHLRREYSLAHDDLNECLPPRFERYLRKKADENDAADEKVNDKTTTDVVDDEAASSSSATTAAARQAPGTPSPHSSPRAGRSPLRTRSPESLLSRDRVDSPLYHLSRAGAGAGGQVNESVGNAADEYARLRREYLRRRHSTSQPPGPRPRVLVHASTSPGDSATATNNNSSRTSDGRPAQRSRAQSLLGATAAVMLGTGATRKPTSSMLARANSAPGGPKKGLHVQQQPQQQQRWRHPFQLGGGGGGGGGDGGGGDGGGGGKSRASSPAAAGAPSLATMPDLEIGAEMPVPQTTAPRREVVRHEHEMDDDNDDDAHHPIVALGPRPTSAAPATDHERTPLLRQRRLSPAGAHSHLATRALSSNDDDNGGEQEETSREGALDPPPSPRRHSVRSLTAREDVLDDYFARPSLPLPVVIAQHLQLYFASCRQKSLIDGLGPAGAHHRTRSETAKQPDSAPVAMHNRLQRARAAHAQPHRHVQRDRLAQQHCHPRRLRVREPFLCFTSRGPSALMVATGVCDDAGSTSSRYVDDRR